MIGDVRGRGAMMAFELVKFERIKGQPKKKQKQL